MQYERIPEPMLARALGAVKAIAWAGVPLSPLLAGVLTDSFGIQSALVALGAIALLLTLVPFLAPVFRRLNERPAAVPAAT